MQSFIVVIRLIDTDLRTNKICLNKMRKNDFQRLPVLLIHAYKKHRHHENHHSHGRKARIPKLPKKEKRRNSNECRQRETNKLPFGEIKHHLTLYLREITRYCNIRCQIVFPPFL